MKRLSIIILLLFASFLIFGQNCSKYHKSIGCRVTNSEGFKPFGQSKSAILDAGKTYKYQVVLFGGYDYKIGLCTEKGFTPIHLKIINAENQTVFYDNSEDEYTETVGFSNEITKNVIFEVTLMASEMEFRDIGDTRACLGVAILWHKIPKMGIGDE